MLAAGHGHGVIMALISAGADVNAVSNDGAVTALLDAALFGHAEAIKALIVAGTDVNRLSTVTAVPYSCSPPSINSATVTQSPEGTHFCRRRRQQGATCVKVTVKGPPGDVRAGRETTKGLPRRGRRSRPRAN